MQQAKRLMWIWMAAVLIPSAAWAQASITGVVKDGSGAVLPGVTVEASSPALIEKVRAVITDGTGQYRFENLRPGAYTVVFTLPGFATVRREGVELAGSFTATINADMRVGGLEETITVTGETPVVDVQSTTRQSVLDHETLSAIPVGQSVATVAMLISTVTTTSAGVDLSGTDGEARFGPAGDNFVRGVSEPRMVIGGLSLHSAQGSGESGGGNFLAFQEVVVDTGGANAEMAEGGVRMELVPREGGNNFSGTVSGAFANESMQGDNFTQELRDQGLRTPNSLKRFTDFNFAFGGPIVQNKVWFHTAGRYNAAREYVPIFVNKASGDPNVWTYVPDTSERAVRAPTWKGLNGRVTWQANPKNKFAVAYDIQPSCQCPVPTATIDLEAAEGSRAILRPKDFLFGDWTSPLTNRLLVEAHVLKHREHAFRPRQNGYFINDPGGVPMIGVTEQTGNLQYRADTGNATDTWNRTILAKFMTSYITGAHSFRVGISHDRASQEQERFALDSPISYRFRNGVPNRLTMQATPYDNLANSTTTALFAQDRWTINRLTVSGGLRYDHFRSYFPEVTLGPGPLVPTRNFVLPGGEGVSWNDLSPRLGAAYDLFGTGKTALKASMNKYLSFHPLSNSGGPFTTAMAPASRVISSTDRSWNDANRDFVANCDLLNPAANGECGPMSNSDFGSPRPGVNYDPDVTTGWGKRDYNWQFSAGLQQELLPRVSVSAEYFHTSFGNLIVTDDLARSPEDFDEFSITAPADPRLPGGGGFVISGLRNITPAAFGRPAEGLLTFADNYGDMDLQVNGFDISVDARPASGLLFRGGTSTERTSRNDCAVRAAVPEALAGLPAALPDADPFSVTYCDVTGAWRTQFKGFGSYTIPRVDVMLSGTVQSLAGPEILAEFVASNALVASSLGRPLAGGANNVTVNLVEPGTIFGARVNQLDFRIGKVLRFGASRANISLDIFNVFNANTPLTFNNSFGSWQAPTSVQKPRLLKVVAQLDF
jgi:hypothetical protein